MRGKTYFGTVLSSSFNHYCPRYFMAINSRSMNVVNPLAVVLRRAPNNLQADKISHPPCLSLFPRSSLNAHTICQCLKGTSEEGVMS